MVLMIPIHLGSCPERPQSFSVRPSPNSVPSAHAPDPTGYETPHGNAFQRAGWRHTGLQWLATVSSLTVLFLAMVLANLTIVTNGIAGQPLPPLPPPILFSLQSGVVATYGPSGAVINPSLIKVNGAKGLAVSGAWLFLINGTSIAKYNANYGTVINANFITLEFSGASDLLVSGNTLFVTNTTSGTVGTYDATTGLPIPPGPIAVDGGTGTPTALAISGTNLFVSDFVNGAIEEYDATSGVLLNANVFQIPTPPTGTVPGIVHSPALALLGNFLYVAKAGGIDMYNVVTTVYTQNFITGLRDPAGLTAVADTVDGTLLVSNNDNGTIDIYDATTGALIAAPFITQLSAPTGIVVTAPTATPVAKDFNGDGFADLVWDNTSTGQLAIWLLKNGVYSSESNLPATSPSWHIAGVGDFLDNGQSDLVFENLNGQHAIWILQGGVFQSSLTLPTVPAPWHVVGAGDFNGDGNADLVWENSTTGDRAIWFLNQGVFVSEMSLPTTSPSWHIAGVGDFLGSGQSDLVFENTMTGQHAIWILQDGVFQSSINLPTLPAPWHIMGAGDFNGDGQADLVWQNTSTGQVAIWFLTNGELTSSVNLPVAPVAWSIENH
jgi:hypothetical protein